MNPGEMKAIVLRLVEEAFNRGNLTVVDELLAPDFVDHDPPPGTATGSQGFKEVIALFRAAFSDFHMRLEEQIVEGNTVAFRDTYSGTHDGAFLGLNATGRRVEVKEIHIVRFVDGHIVEHYYTGDDLGMMRQLGVVPEMDDLVQSQ